MSAMLQENPCKTVRNSVNNRPPRNDRTQCAISREILGKMNKNEFILFLQFSTLEFCIASHTEKNRNIFAKKIFVKSLFFFIVFLFTILLFYPRCNWGCLYSLHSVNYIHPVFILSATKNTSLHRAWSKKLKHSSR